MSEKERPLLHQGTVRATYTKEFTPASLETEQNAGQSVPSQSWTFLGMFMTPRDLRSQHRHMNGVGAMNNLNSL